MHQLAFAAFPCWRRYSRFAYTCQTVHSIISVWWKMWKWDYAVCLYTAHDWLTCVLGWVFSIWRTANQRHWQQCIVNVVKGKLYMFRKPRFIRNVWRQRSLSGPDVQWSVILTNSTKLHSYNYNIRPIRLLQAHVVIHCAQTSAQVHFVGVYEAIQWILTILIFGNWKRPNGWFFSGH